MTIVNAVATSMPDNFVASARIPSPLATVRLMSLSSSIHVQTGDALLAVDVHTGDGARALAEMQQLGARPIRYEDLAP